MGQSRTGFWKPLAAQLSKGVELRAIDLSLVKKFSLPDKTVGEKTRCTFTGSFTRTVAASIFEVLRGQRLTMRFVPSLCKWLTIS